MWSFSSTVTAPAPLRASGTLRNGLSSTAGLVILSISALMNCCWRTTLSRSARAVARVRTKPSAWRLSSTWQPAPMLRPALGSFMGASTQRLTPPTASTSEANPSKPISM
jgi:hypothetical protein